MDDDQVRLFRERFRRLQRRIRTEAPGPSDVARSSLQVLGAVIRADGPVQPGELAAGLSMASSNVAAALRELEATGYVTRTRDTADSRRVFVSATYHGNAVHARFREARDSWLGQAIAATLTEREQDELVRAGELLDRLAEFG